MPEASELAPPQDLTNWRLGNIEDSLKAVLAKLEETAGLADRVKRLEDWQTWALRIVVGAVLTGLVLLWAGAGGKL